VRIANLSGRLSLVVDGLAVDIAEASPAAGNQSRQCRQPQAVARLVADPADLAAQDRVLVPEHQKLGILG
jgi:hypothetical protein